MHTTKLCGEKEFDSFDSSVGGFTAELLQSSLQIQQCAENVWRFCEYCNNGIHIRSPGGSMPFVCIKMVLEDTHFCFGKSPKIFNELSQNKLTTKCDQSRIVLNLLRFLCVSYSSIHCLAIIVTLFLSKDDDRICTSIPPLPFQLTGQRTNKMTNFEETLRAT